MQNYTNSKITHTIVCLLNLTALYCIIYDFQLAQCYENSLDTHKKIL